MRYLLATLLLLAASTAEAARYLPLLSIIVAEVESAPAPTPPPGEVCDNCGGTGKLGDGTVAVECPVCGGDGRLDRAPAAAAPALVDAASRLAADQQPSPMRAIGAALRALEPRVGEVFYDLGCGPDARACIVAARDCGLTAVGVEVDPAVAESARRTVAANGLADKITIVTADAAEIDVPAGAIGYAYLFPEDLERLAPQIRKFSRFATYAHAAPGLPMRSVGGGVYLYEAPRLVVRTVRPKAAYWGGRAYRRARPGCNCAMCRSLRAQLAPRQQYVWQEATTQQPQSATAQPRGRWVVERICRNGRCSYVRTWQEF